jgi:PAS domain S-box-containing protein
VVYDDAGHPTDLVGVVLDVTDREEAKEARNRAQRRQEFLLQFNDHLRGFEDPGAIIETATQMVGTFFGSNRVGYGAIDTAEEHVIVEREWTDGSIASIVGRHRIDDFGPSIVSELKQGRTLRIEDTAHDDRAADPATQAAFAIIETRSAVTVPLLKNRRLTAVLYLHHREPRRWTDDDVALAEDLAERIWAAVERAGAEAELRESEARFRAIAETLPALVWMIDPEVRALYANARWTGYTGLSIAETLGDGWMQAIHPDDSERFMREAGDVRQREAAFQSEIRYRSANGTFRWHMVQAEPIRNARGEFRGWFGASVDIHDRKETEAALRDSEARLRLAQEAGGVGLWDCDLKSGKVFWSPNVHKLAGLIPGFAGGAEAWKQLMHPEDRLKAAAAGQAALRGERPLDIEARIIRPIDGETVWLAVRGEVMRGPTGEPERIIGINFDITDRKETEERQNLLIRELHHRVKNTLASVQAIVGSTARTASSIDEFYQAFVGRIVALARTHNLLTEDYWQKASLEMLLRNELGPYEDGDQHRITLEGPSVELPSQVAVPIGMAIHELTTNAVKHGALSTGKGQIDVRWRVEREGDEAALRFDWTERGGPAVMTPTRQGFGSRLLQRVLTTQLQADVHMDFDADGVRFAMTMPLSKQSTLIPSLS